MNLLEEKIRNIIKETAETNGYFLIDLVFRGTSNNRVIEVYIDNERDVSAENCASISREINAQVEPLIDSSYRLDVSSPGVDRPLKYLKQYPKNINRKFEVSYFEIEHVNPGESELVETGNQGKTKKFAGKLISVEGEDLIFLVNNREEKKVKFNNIKKAKVIISFS